MKKIAIDNIKRYFYHMNNNTNIKTKDVYGSIPTKNGDELFRGTRVWIVHVSSPLNGGKKYITDINLN